MSCNLNSITDCGMSTGGVSEVFVFPYKSLHSYTFLPNNNSKIETYRADALAVPLCVRASSRLDEVMLEGQTPRFEATLTLSVSKMEWEKRIEIVKMIRQSYQIIVRDKNGKSWLLGYANPVRLTGYKATTDAVTGENTYELTFKVTEAAALREIPPYDPTCAVSTVVTEVRQSVLTIPNASSYDFSGLYELLGDNETRGFTPTAWQPTLWAGSPTIYNTDLGVMQALINPNGNSEINLFTYDIGSDTVYIGIISTDTSYPLMSIGGQAITGVTTIQLNIVTNVSATLTDINITLTDSALVELFNAPYGDVISGTGISGRSNDAYIDVTALYPAGETFTISVTSASTPCADTLVTYSYEPSADCGLESSYSLHNGKRYAVVVDKLTEGETYRQMSLHFDGVAIPLYTNWADYHSVFATLQTDVLNAIAANPDLNFSNVSVTEQANTWTLFLTAQDSELDIFVTTYGDEDVTLDDPALRYFRKFYATRTIVLALQTIAPSDSLLVVENLANSDFLQGLYNSPVAVSTFELESVSPITLDVTRSVGIVINDWDETDTIEVSNVSTACPDLTISTTIDTCLDGVQHEQLYRYSLYKLDVNSLASNNLGKNVTLALTAFGSVTLTVPNDITPNSVTDISLAAEALTPTIKSLTMSYDNALGIWWLEIITPNANFPTSVTLDDITEVMVASVTDDLHRYFVTGKQHPNISLTWGFVTSDLTVTGYAGVVQDALFKDDKSGANPLGELVYNSGTDVFSIIFYQNSNVTNGWEVSFHNAYPVTGNELYSVTLPFPVGSDTVPAFSTALTLGDINYIRIRNGDGYEQVMYYNLPADNNVTIYPQAITPTRQAWGRFDDYFLRYTLGVPHPLPTLTRVSTNCPNTDTDVLAFLAAAGISDSVIEGALDVYVTTIKTANLWDRHDAIYPFVGGNASAHKLNLKNPADTDAAFRLTFFGGITHNSNGITPNGINGYANTHYTETVQSLLNDKHISIYSRVNLLGQWTDMAAYNGTNAATDISPRFFTSGERCLMRNGNVAGSSYLNTNSLGFFLNNRVDAGAVRARQDTTLQVIASASIALVNVPYYIGANNLNGTAGSYSVRNLSYASIGRGFSDAESLIVANAVIALQVALSR